VYIIDRATRNLNHLNGQGLWRVKTARLLVPSSISANRFPLIQVP